MTKSDLASRVAKNFGKAYLALGCGLPVIDSTGYRRVCGAPATATHFLGTVELSACDACADNMAEQYDPPEPRRLPSCPIPVVDEAAGGTMRPCGENTTTPRIVGGVHVHVCARCARALDDARDAAVLAQPPYGVSERARARAAWIALLLGSAEWTGKPLVDLVKGAGPPPYATPGDGEEEYVVQLAATLDALPVEPDDVDDENTADESVDDGGNDGAGENSEA
jgi:hypothetical protein